jgi:ABC-type transporter Mla maintaining outer membrane lipid asymmetry ATPase subunit MlaF
MAQDTVKEQPQSVTLFEALDALEKVKIYMLQQEQYKNDMMEEYARLRAEASGTDERSRR